MIKKLLLCTPAYFDIEYSINPWMNVDNRVNKDKAWSEWHNLISVIKSLGVGVEVIDGAPGLPDMTFAGDCGMVVDGTFLASNFRCRERQGERDHYLRWMKDHGYVIREIPSDVCFEGLGDVIYADDTIVFGYGPRSDKKAIDYIRECFPKLKIKANVFIKDGAYFHIAMAAGLIDPDTIVYYPPAFTEESVDEIKATFKHAIDVSGDDANRDFVCNNIVIGRNVLVDNCSADFERRLNDVGYAVVKCPVGEFKKSGASLRCLVLNI